MNTLKDIIHYVLGKTDWMKTMVGMSFVGIFLFTVVYVLTRKIPTENTEIAHFVAGEVSGVALTIAAYYFGSSKGSQDKAETIKKHMSEQAKE